MIIIVININLIQQNKESFISTLDPPIPNRCSFKANFSRAPTKSSMASELHGHFPTTVFVICLGTGGNIKHVDNIMQ